MEVHRQEGRTQRPINFASITCLSHNLIRSLVPPRHHLINLRHTFANIGRKEDESHFHVVVVSDLFEGVPIIKRHQAIMGLFKDESGCLKFHALRITAKTPSQWEKMGGNVPVAPKCTGKGDGRGPTDTTKL
jgi:stress-induced morphogen